MPNVCYEKDKAWSDVNYRLSFFLYDVQKFGAVLGDFGTGMRTIGKSISNQ
jgi:hypothetical protein